jgi:hypothetical protein
VSSKCVDIHNYPVPVQSGTCPVSSRNEEHILESSHKLCLLNFLKIK